MSPRKMSGVQIPPAASWLAMLHAASSGFAIAFALLAALASLVLRALDKPLTIANALANGALGLVTVGVVSCQVLGAIRRLPFDSLEGIYVLWWTGLIVCAVLRMRKSRGRRRAATLQTWQTIILVVGPLLILARNYLG